MAQIWRCYSFGSEINIITGSLTYCNGGLGLVTHISLKLGPFSRIGNGRSGQRAACKCRRDEKPMLVLFLATPLASDLLGYTVPVAEDDLRGANC